MKLHDSTERVHGERLCDMSVDRLILALRHEVTAAYRPDWDYNKSANEHRNNADTIHSEILERFRKKG